MNAPSPSLSVLLVDDSVYWTETIGARLREEGYAVTTLHDGLAAVERLRRSPPSILITDYFLANLDGGKLCQVAKQLAMDPPITTIILTGGADRTHSRTPSKYADTVIAKNTSEIVFEDLQRALQAVRASVPTQGDPGEVIGYDRLEPRLIAGKLRGLKQYLDALHEGIGDAVLGLDAQRRVYFMSSVATEVFDVNEQDALARPIEEVLGIPVSHPLILRINDALDGRGSARTPLTLEVGVMTFRVTVALLETPDLVPTALVIARDISDLKAAEQARIALDARLHEADKMTSLGHLVAGVSHEINNPLAALLLNLRLLEDPVRLLAEAAASPEESAEIGISLDDSLAAAERIRAIVAEMRMFAQPERTPGEAVRMEDLLEGPLTLVANEVRFKAKIVRAFSETPALVVDRMPLSQAFLNIILNAIQAIEVNDLESNWIRLATSSAPDGVVVEISNSGPAIPKSTLAKIFEPFFTTRPVGTGVGLGLSLAFETVKRHGGNIEARSEEGKPMCVRIWLPFDTGLVLDAARTGNVELGVPPGRAARLLIVDDDKLVRTSLRRILERHHDVTLAATGERALELIAERPFDLVICDLIMPGMTGMDLFAEVNRVAPRQAVRFVFLTGGTNSVQAREFLSSVQNPRAFKPLHPDELLKFVDRALQQFEKDIASTPTHWPGRPAT